MAWWIWIVAGLALCVGELLTPGGFYLLFFGAGALAVGIIDRLGWIVTPWVEWFLFIVFSIGALLFFRQPLRERLQEADPDEPIDDLVNEEAVAVDDIGVDDRGKVELRGTSWNAKNSGPTPIVRGQRCRIERVEGITLWVHGEGRRTTNDG